VDVGLVLEQCLAPVPGGAGRYSRELAKALAAHAPAGSSVHGVTAFHRTPLVLDQLPIARLPLPRRALTLAWERGGFPAVPGDLVHALTPLHPRRGSKPLVVSVHDAVPWTFPETLTPRGAAWHRAMVTRAASEADLLVVPTQATADQLARHMPLRDVLVVGMGPSQLPLPDDAEARAERLGLPDAFLLTISTLEPRKGLRELVAALEDLPGMPLLCVGQAGWGDVAQSLPPSVRLLGHVPDADLAVLLHRATALVVPSYDEGFGLPLLEGMAAGVPVLTSDAPALVEVAGGAALAVPLADLVDGLRQVVEDRALRSRLAEAGPRRAAEFSWEKAATAMWRAYAHLGRSPSEKA
jgi:glycosyltransferase involved in cell wall biosynthesis